jgi:hypothetical protein
MAFHLAPPHRIIGSDGFRVFTPPHCCGPATYFCLQTSPGYSLLLAEVQPIFTYYSTFASPGAKDLRIGQAKPIAPPRPPQTPAASSKSPYRKCPGGTHLWTHAAARRRRICDRELRFFANNPFKIPATLRLSLTCLPFRHSILAHDWADHLALPRYREARRWWYGRRLQS